MWTPLATTGMTVRATRHGETEHPRSQQPGCVRFRIAMGSLLETEATAGVLGVVAEDYVSR
jgi:hypothetical protein